MAACKSVAETGRMGNVWVLCCCCWMAQSEPVAGCNGRGQRRGFLGGSSDDREEEEEGNKKLHEGTEEE